MSRKIYFLRKHRGLTIRPDSVCILQEEICISSSTLNGADIGGCLTKFRTGEAESRERRAIVLRGTVRPGLLIVSQHSRYGEKEDRIGKLEEEGWWASLLPAINISRSCSRFLSVRHCV